MLKASLVETLPGGNKTLFVLALKEDIFLYEARLNVLKELDKIACAKVTSLACNEEFIAVGWAPFGFGVGTEFTAKVKWNIACRLKVHDLYILVFCIQRSRNKTQDFKNQLAQVASCFGCSLVIYCTAKNQY